MIEAMRFHEVVLPEPIVGEYEAIAGRLAHAPYRDGLLAIIGELEQGSSRRMRRSVSPIRMMKCIRQPRWPATPFSLPAIVGISHRRDKGR